MKNWKLNLLIEIENEVECGVRMNAKIKKQKLTYLFEVFQVFLINGFHEFFPLLHVLNNQVKVRLKHFHIPI